MSLRRHLGWAAASLALPVLLPALFIAIFGWNWLRGPIERQTLSRTGRVLTLAGDLTLRWAWPLPHVLAQQVSFANPAWARQPMMLTADSAEITLDAGELVHGRLALPDVLLRQPVVYLEQASGGRKSWLLDRQQTDETARVRIDRLRLDQGLLRYDDLAHRTRIESRVSTRPPSDGEPGVRFQADGLYLGQALKASGSGGPVLALRDEITPYPIEVDAMIGHTGIRAKGRVTSLTRFHALDMEVALSGDSLDQLFPLLGIALPATNPYVLAGHVLHEPQQWRIERFAGRLGGSDVSGQLQLQTGGARPALQGEIASSVLDIADLGPMLGAQAGSVQRASVPGASARILPDLPFHTERWRSADADLSLRARSIRRAKALPLENLQTHLSLNDAVLRLAPLQFAVGGGDLSGSIELDGRSTPIAAHARLQARKVQLARLLPQLSLNRSTLGQIQGELDLKGRGPTVAAMLAGADGQASLVVANGKVSRLMMEQAGLHLWEMLQLSLTGDQQIDLRCAMTRLEVKQGQAHVAALVFDTQVATIEGSGNIDLAQERLDITLLQKTKNTSPLALTAPIYLRGSLARPEVSIDKGRVALRALGALALGVVNPLLALLPLVDAGPGNDSDCAHLLGPRAPAAQAAKAAPTR